MNEYDYDIDYTIEDINESSITVDYTQSAAITGNVNERTQLYGKLCQSMKTAQQIDIIVSFLMESGVKLLIKELQASLNRGAKIRILTGNYLGITQPSALYMVKRELGDKVDLRFYNEKKRSFHPKAYIFHYGNFGTVYIGSSNVSRSALTSGIEWNYRFNSQLDKKNYDKFCETFDDLFENHAFVINDAALQEYAKSWRKPAVQRDLDRYDASDKNEVIEFYEPRGAQIEALYALEHDRQEGADKGLVCAATGIGKTYLAAFDSKGYEKVLFVAHRTEILTQAAESFRNVRKSEDYGFFDQKHKDTDKSVIFASVSTLGREEYLCERYFAKDYFSYICIDESHHVVSDGYKKILEYFKPQYTLGLTATPDRLDGRNVYEIFDYNVPFHISLQEAINKGMLVPFRYYGIYDDTVDYNEIHIVKGKYIEKELDEKLLITKRYDLIFQHYQKYPSLRAMGFCCTRAHAEAMAEAFCNRGVQAVAVYSNAESEFSEDRQRAIEKLKNGDIRVIFSVDMFNEGVDIPSIDMVMFLRPTESPTIFLQQLGRGLRKNRGKEYLIVLDFIGNYKKAGNVPFLLSGKSYSTEFARIATQKDFDFPEDCIVDFDLRLIDIFQKMAAHGMKKQEIICAEFRRIMELTENKVPTRMDLFTNMEEEIYQLCQKSAKDNPFRNYISFLKELNLLSDDELKIYNGIGREFLHTLETTSMSKSYKMPILLAFFNNGNIKLNISEEDVYQNYKSFYSQGINWKDLEKDKGSRDFHNWTKTRYVAEAKKNPVNFLLKSGNGFFVEREGYVLGLDKRLEEFFDNAAFVKHMKDIIEYRTMDYYKKRYQNDIKDM